MNTFIVFTGRSFVKMTADQIHLARDAGWGFSEGEPYEGTLSLVVTKQGLAIC